MSNRDIWSDISYKDLPEDKIPIGLKWVLQIKKDGCNKACLVALGFLQIPVKYFTVSHAPVLHNVSLRVIIVMKFLNPTWKIQQLDVEASFLEGNVIIIYTSSFHPV